ncbi:MAG: hypothetical protein U0X20_31980 [Caldilineaceae bacterium]
MAIVDRTRDWWNSLDNYVMMGTTLAPVSEETRRYDTHHREETAPERPTRQEWDPGGTGAGGMLGNFRHLFDTLQLFGAGESASLFRRSLLLAPQQTGVDRYPLVAGDLEARGRLYMLDVVPPAAPFTADLQRFVIYIPARYTRTGGSGHFAWLHFTPVWGGRRGQSPRAAAAGREYPDSVWVHKYITDYLVGHRLLASFAASDLNAVFVLPVHRLPVGDALAPLANMGQLLQILGHLFGALEAVDPRLRAGRSDRAGLVAGVGVSCYSFGAHYCARLFRRPAAAAHDYMLRAGAFLDGVTPEARSACQWMAAPVAGWLRHLLPGTNDIPRRLVLFQQPNSGGTDFTGPFPQTVQAAPLSAGETLDVLAAAPAWRNVARFHRVDMQDMMCAAREPHCRDPRHRYFDWHGHIHALFAETAFHFCRDCFLW